jgi:PAS domain S-box-containing protein
MDVGVYIIFLNVSFIIYFAFRDSIRGGLISSGTSILYYFYIILTRHYAGQQFTTSIETIIGLAVLYILLATIIGWLKRQIDTLIEREADEKRRLEAIIQQLPVGVLITDSKGRLTQRNKRLDAILGTKLPIGFIVGKDTLSKERINGKSIQPPESPLFNSLKSGKPLIGKEFLYTNKKGGQLSLQVSSAPILNKKRKIIAAASIINDITRQKELEQQKDDFLGIASHELKTPVTSIKAYEQVLQAQFSKKGEAKAVEQLQKMDTQVNKLTSLIEDLLDVTKIHSRKLEFNPNYFDFNELVIEIVEELKLTTDHKFIAKLEKTKTIYADRERIGQVVTNLITNAIKYSPHSKKIYVKTTTNNDSITLCVEDFGVGIPKNKQNKVF